MHILFPQKFGQKIMHYTLQQTVVVAYFGYTSEKAV